MKKDEYGQMMKYMTRPATGSSLKPKPIKSNVSETSSKKSSNRIDQDSKPGRARFIVNPITHQYENTDYSIQQSIDKHTEFSPAQKAAFTEFYSKDDRIADEARELQKEKKLMGYLENVKSGKYNINNDTKTLKKLSGYQPHKRVAAATNFYPTIAMPAIDLAPLVADIDAAEQQITDRKKYEQTIINPDASEGIAGILINKNRRKI